jgi:flagellar basal body P-ring formation protein FlgA
MSSNLPIISNTSVFRSGPAFPALKPLCEAEQDAIGRKTPLLGGYSVDSWTFAPLIWQASENVRRRAMVFRIHLFFALVFCTYAGLAGAQLDEHSIQLYLEKERVGVNGRVEVTLGEIDPRLRLAPCAKVEPFIPRGAKLWGRSNIGVRCVEGASWTTYMPVHVRIYAPALVAARPLSAGQDIGPADYRIEEVELTKEAPGVFTDPAQLEDRVLMRGIAAGQALRADHTRIRPVVSAGDQVKVSYIGAGFVVAAEGKALSQAGNGQNVRVQTGTGKILSGVARPGRVVEIRS